MHAAARRGGRVGGAAPFERECGRQPTDRADQASATIGPQFSWMAASAAADLLLGQELHLGEQVGGGQVGLVRLR